MAASKFDGIWRGFLELIGDGLSFKDACRECKVQQKTVRNWLAKGRNGDERYAEFATIFDASKEAVEQKEDEQPPMDCDELRRVVSKAARLGSVQAMKLMEEMLRREGEGKGQDQGDPFDQLDGETADDLAQKRREKEAAGG